MKIKKITYAGVLLAMGIILPQAFHFTGVPQSGAVFLPMHISVLLSGFILGPIYGLMIGIITPILSSFLTGMPAFARLPFMIGELGVYGLMTGLLFTRSFFTKKPIGTYLTLFSSMVLGRIMYGLMLTIGLYALGIPCGGPIAAINATVMGIPGIIIQLVTVPPVVLILKKGGLLNGFVKSSKEHVISD